MTRRHFLQFAALAMGSSALFGCKKRQPQSARERVPSEIDAIQPALDDLRLAWQHAGVNVDAILQPGLSREAISRITADVPFTLPKELYELYMWRNGTQPAADMSFFRDQNFISLQQAVAEWQQIERYYDEGSAFPFAAFMGAWYALPIEPYQFQPNLERPVISIFEGVDVYFYSLLHLIQTQTAWVQNGIHLPNQPVDAALELKIWQTHNPGIFSAQ